MNRLNISSLRGPIAYLTGEYPRVSHTFIQREIEGLRRLGFTVHPCTIRSPGRDQLIGIEENSAFEETFCVLRFARNPVRLLIAHLSCLVRFPKNYVSAFVLAFKTSTPGLVAKVYQMFYFAEAGILAQYMRINCVKHLHNHFADSSCTVAMLSAKISGVPFSFSMHGPTEFFAVERWCLRDKIAQARFIACISHFCRSQCMIFSDPKDWQKLHIVHCGVEPKRYKRVAKKSGSIRLVFVGRLVPLKGASVLLSALAELRDHGVLSLDPKFMVEIIGDGPAREELERQAEFLKLSEIVKFIGYLSQGEVAKKVGAADVLILPSFAEGVPVVLMEAMASSVPVITTRVGGVGELVEDGVSGLTVAPGSSDDLAEAIRRLIADPELRQEMGAAGRAMVEAEFDIGAEASRLGTLFQAYACDSFSAPDVRPVPSRSFRRCQDDEPPNDFL